MRRRDRTSRRGLFSVVSIFSLVFLAAWLPQTWGGEGDEKVPLKLPEVVILGYDVSVLKEAKERLVPQELTQVLKEVPSEAREKIDLATLEPTGKTAPDVARPGCLFGNPVTGSIARAFLGDEGQYKVGLYRYQTGDYPGAIEAFSRLQQEYSRSPWRGSALYWVGESHYRLGEFDKALSAYQQVLQHFPTERLRDYTLLSAAEIHLRHRRPAAGVVLLRELLAQYPASPIATQGRYYLAEALFRGGEYAEAADVYGQLLQAPHAHAYRTIALFWRAESFFQAGVYEQAEQGYGEFFRLHPRHERAEEALYGLGWAQLNAQKYRSALDTFQRLVQVVPQTRFLESLLYARIRASLGLKHMQDAEATYRQLLRQFPAGKWSGAATLEFARAAYQVGDYATALALSRQLIETFSHSPFVPIARVVQADILYREGRFAEAIDAYRRAERDGLTADILEVSLLKQALASYQRRDFAAAAADLDRFLQTFPASPHAAEAAFWLGESRFYNRQYRQALQAYLQVSPESPRYPDALYGRGWVYYQGSDWLKAAAEFEQVIHKYPGAPIRPEALYRFGEVQFNLKNFDNAIAAYEQLLREYPRSELVPRGRFRIGWVRYKTGNLRQATLDFSDLVRAYPKHAITPEAHYWLGMAYMGEKQLAQARAEFEAVLAWRPASHLTSQAILRLGDTFYNEGKFEQAIDAYGRLTKQSAADPHTPEAEYGIILALYQLRRLGDYYTRARAFVERYPTNPLGVTVLYQLAELLAAENRTQLALDTFQEVINRYAQSELVESAHLRRAEIFAGQKQWSAALAEYRQTLAMARSEVAKLDALYGLARAQHEQKLYEEAADSYRRVVRESPTGRFVTASLRGLAQVLTLAGRRAEAKRAWQEFLERGPAEASAAEAHVELAVLLRGEGAHQNALEHLSKALTQSPPEVAAQAQYEIGHTYSLLKNYQQGALEFLKVAYLFPEQKRWVHRALFQAAASYEHAQKWQEALAIYQKIVKEVAVPESRAQAAQKIEQLKKKLGSGA